MSRKPCAIRAPNDGPAHQVLWKLALTELDDGLQEVLREILRFTNAHYDLVAFPQVCSNLIHILKTSEVRWKVSLEVWGIELWPRVLEWVVRNRDRLSEEITSEDNRIGGTFDPSTKKNPIVSRWASRHPLYAALWETHRDPSLETRYALLQAHLLVANVVAMRRWCTRTDYETYAEIKEWNALPNSVSTAALGLRNLSSVRGTTSSTVNSCTGTTYSGNLNTTATDGSAYKLVATPQGGSTITSASGHQYVSNCSGSNCGSWDDGIIGTRTDPNGNQLTSNASGQMFDTLSSITPVLTLAGGGTATSAATLTYVAPKNVNATYTVNFTEYTVATNFGVPGISEFGPASEPLVSSVVLPDGTQYTFNYEVTPGSCTPIANTYAANCVTGRMAQITLPTGGAITYEYSGGTNNTGIYSDGSTATLTRTLSPGGTWQYDRVPQNLPDATCSLCVTTVTDPEGNQTVSNCAAFTQIYLGEGNSPMYQSNPVPNLYMTSQVVYQGSAANNQVLSTTTKTYNNEPPASATLPISGIYTYTQLPDGKVRSSQVTYNGAYSGSGLIDSDVEYDYGDMGNWRKTLVGYAALNGILDKPGSVSIYDANGMLVAETSYSYDQTGVTGTSGTEQHTSVSGSRGNLTTISRLGSSSPSFTSTYTYYDTGLVRAATDVNSGVTSYTYGDCGNSFPSNVSGPTGLTAQATWDCTGGVQLTATDANGNMTSSTYTDPDFWWPSSSTDAAGNVTNYSYTPASSGTLASAESNMPFSGSSSASDVLTTLDPFGRTLTTQVRQAPGSPNFDTVSHAYDSMGRPSFTSLPYNASAGQANTSGPGQSISYDALSRTVRVSDSGGGFKAISFAAGNNDTLLTAGPAPGCENPKQRQNEFDGLGRLTSVCEVTSGTGSGTCGQSTPQTGYWTKYTYNALNQILSVTQNAQAAAASQQTRSFTYDLLGRMTSETNPENGLTTYTYDTDPTCGSSNGDLVKKVDAAGNVTCIAYDLLHRPTQISYPSGPYSATTPTKHFVYDAPLDGVAVVNTKGRLAEAYTGTSASKITDVAFSYSPRGETTDVYQMTPNSGGYSHVSTSGYWANGLPKSLNGIPSVPTITYGIDGEGRPNSVSASTGQNPVLSATYNPSGQVTGLQYGSQDSDSFIFDPNTGRMISYQYMVNAQLVAGSLTWNSDGSLGLLAISDTFNTANSQTCTYGNDDLGRIANTTCLPVGSQTPIWAQTFAYDPFGNISKNATVGISFAPVYSPATNQFSGAYDANGNLTTDSVHQYSWDADSNLISVDGITKTFDALGRVVEQLNGGTYTQILYAPWGDKVALVSVNTLQKAYVPLVGGATAVYSGTGLAYRHPDWLGSSRFASTSVQPTAVSYSGAYAPYGESYSETGTTDRSFTGQNQDTESGLYDFPTRGYSPVESRWLSPDKAGVAAANPGDPQSWNRYAYVHNKPLGAVDPLGQDGIVVFCDPNCGGSDDSTSDDSGDDSIGDDIVNTFEGIGNDIGNFFSGLFGGGGGGHSSPPPPPAKQYAQSSVSSDSAKAVQSALGSGSSVSVTNNPGIPSPAPANNGDDSLSPYALAVFSQPSLQLAANVMTDPRTYVAWAGASAVVGGAGVAAANAVSAESAPAIFNSSKVLSQTDLYHNFGELIGRQAMNFGNVAIRNGSYIQWNLPGVVNGVSGVFQYGGTIGATGSVLFGNVLYVTHTFFQTW